MHVSVAVKLNRSVKRVYVSVCVRGREDKIAKMSFDILIGDKE